MKYQIAERFKSFQGEGVYTNTPMAFIRFVGCSVGKKICQHCDTDFDRPYPWQGGGEFTSEELVEWVGDYSHVCFTGGEPFDQDLLHLVERLSVGGRMIHVESSGTRPIPYWYPLDGGQFWLCVSPKPGFIEQVIDEYAHEVKVLVHALGGGLGTDASLKVLQADAAKNGRSWHPLAFETIGMRRFEWPTLEDALRWADHGKTVFLQPRNDKYTIDANNLALVQELVLQNPSLRMSTQAHKALRVR